MMGRAGQTLTTGERMAWGARGVRKEEHRGRDRERHRGGLDREDIQIHN